MVADIMHGVWGGSGSGIPYCASPGAEQHGTGD